MIDYQPPATEQGRMIDVTPQADTEKTEGESEEKSHTEGPEKPFDKLDAKGQKDVLKKLIGRKGYPESKLKKSLDNFTDDERKKFFDHLNKMADVEELPFE